MRRCGRRDIEADSAKRTVVDVELGSLPRARAYAHECGVWRSAGASETKFRVWDVRAGRETERQRGTSRRE